MTDNMLSFRCPRCHRRHNALSHPKCYIEYLTKKEQKPIKHFRSARILLLDVETLPGEYYAFDPRVELRCK